MIDKTESRKLWDLVSRIVDTRRNARRISPAWIATEAMSELDPGHKIRGDRPLIYIGCHLHLRQIARDLCRTMFAGDKKATAQHEMFPGLQARYPTVHSANSDDPEYIRVEYLTPQDILFNVERLRSEGESKLEHAEALSAYFRKRFPRHQRAA